MVVVFGLTLGELLSDMAGGQIPSGLLGQLLLLKLPEALNTILPLGVFIGVIRGLGRIYREQEMAVMKASGFRWQMMLRPLFHLVLPVAAVVFINAAFVAPMATQSAHIRLENAFRTAAEWGLQAGQFHMLHNGKLILYVEAVEKDGRSLRNIFIVERQQDGREQVWTSERGYYWLDTTSGERFLTLENGQITASGATTLDFSMVRFSRNDLRLPRPQERDQPPAVAASSSADLFFSTAAEDMAEIQWRIAPAISIVVLGLLAIPLSHTAPREGRGAKIFSGFLAYIVYTNVLQMSRSWIASGSMPAVFGLWWVHMLALVIAVFWLQRQGKMVGTA